MILDDLASIHTRDSLDLLGFIGRRWRGLSGAEARGLPSIAGKEFRNVVLVATGEDLSWLQLVAGRPDLLAPCEAVGADQLPAYVGAGSLMLVASDTSAAAEAERRGATVAWSAQSGAVLYETACRVVDAAGLVAGPKDDVEWKGMYEELDRIIAEWGPAIPSGRNPAKQMALEIAGKSAVIYGGPSTYAAARFWKTALNRYSRQLAWSAHYPDAEYAEPIGWTSQPVNKPYAVVELSSDLDGGLARDWSERAKRSLSGMRPEPYIVRLEGSLPFQQLYAAAMAEHVAIYLALLAGNDPSSSAIMEKFKTKPNA